MLIYFGHNLGTCGRCLGIRSKNQPKPGQGVCLSCAILALGVSDLNEVSEFAAPSDGPKPRQSSEDSKLAKDNLREKCT